MLEVYDRVLNSNSEETLLMLTLIVVFLFIVMGGLEWVRSQILIAVSTRFDRLLGGRVFDAVFMRSLATAGKVAGVQPITDIGQMRQFLTGPSLFAFLDAPWVPVYVAEMFFFHPWYGIVTIFAIIVLSALTARWPPRRPKPMPCPYPHRAGSSRWSASSSPRPVRQRRCSRASTSVCRRENNWPSLAPAAPSWSIGNASGSASSSATCRRMLSCWTGRWARTSPASGRSTRCWWWRLTGGAGKDTFDVDAGMDTITDLTKDDTLNVSSGATAVTNVLDFTGFTVNNLGTVVITGISGADTIVGTSGGPYQWWWWR